MGQINLLLRNLKTLETKEEILQFYKRKAGGISKYDTGTAIEIQISFFFRPILRHPVTKIEY